MLYMKSAIYEWELWVGEIVKLLWIRESEIFISLLSKRDLWLAEINSVDHVLKLLHLLK